MASIGTVGQLDGLFKVVYGDSLQNYLPNDTSLQKLVGFDKAKVIGKDFEFPVVVNSENGVTYATGDDDAFTVNDDQTMVTKNAVVNGSSIVIASKFGYLAAEKAKTSKQAFENTVGMKVKEVTAAVRRKVELNLWAGRKTLGSGSGAAFAHTAATVGTLTLASASCAAGFFTPGMKIVIYNGSNAPMVWDGTIDATPDADVLEVVKFNPKTAVLTVTAASATLDEYAALSGAGEFSQIFEYGSVEGNAGTFAYRQMHGIESVLSNAGSLFGIDAGTYDAWQATQITSFGAMSVSSILDAVAQAFQRGLNEDLTLFVNPAQFAVLAASGDVLGKRQFDSSYDPKNGVVGVQSITIHGLNGKIEIMPSPYCKRGIALGLVADYWKRIGAVDFTLVNPGGSDGSIFWHDQTKAAVGFRAMSNQAIVCTRPMTAGLYISGITG